MSLLNFSKLNMAEMDKDFDLLAGHELGEARINTNQDDEDPEKMDCLVWHKLDTVGYQPAAREGHSAVTNGLSVLVFGGFEAGKRVNDLIALEVTSCSWSVVSTKGEVPCPRSYHAASRYRNLMLIHGGETKVDHQPTGHISFDLSDQVAEGSQSLAEDSSATIRVVPSLHSQSTSVLNVPSAALQDTSRGAGYRHDGVTLGDTLCGTKLPGQLKVSRVGSTLNTTPNITIQPAATSTGSIRCLDDLYALDTLSMQWYRLSSILSPLPRKGHTLNLLPLQDSDYAVIFGGYSTENLTLSNSIHICEAELIYEHYTAKRDLHYKSNQQQQQQSGAHVGVIKTLKQDSIKPVIWRTLQTTGTPPSPRYRHSSTLIHSADGTPLLVVMGGIGADATVALNDVHILNLTSLHWAGPITGSDALSQGCGGDGPVSGLYGHVAFSINTLSKQGPNISDSDTASEYELLVFGGSANPNSGQSNCNQSIYAFNLQTGTWRCVRTGYVYPSARANHTAAVVAGWAPAHTLPSSNTADPACNTAAFTHTPSTSSSSMCAVVFGGLDSVQCTSDTWALDLRWRRAGVQQYDSSVQQQETDMLRSSHIHTSYIESKYLQTPGLLNSEHNRSFNNLIDATSTRNIQSGARFNDTNTLKPTSSLEKFKKIPFSGKSNHTATNGTATASILDINSDRNRKQSVNSRKYINLAASNSSVQVSLKDTLQSAGKGSSAAVSEVKRRGSQDGVAAVPIAAQRLSMTQGGPESTVPLQQLHATASNNTMNASLDSADCYCYEPAGTLQEQLDIGSAFLQVRKDRAQTELALQRSREQHQQSEHRVTAQEREIGSLKSEIIKNELQHKQEIEQLKKELQDSRQREQHLLRLNQEAYALMAMYGVKKV